MRRTLLVLAAAVAGGQGLAQPPTPPRPIEPQQLPKLLENAAAPAGPALIAFEPGQLTLKHSDRRWQLWADTQMLKDFGPLEREAAEALRLARELKFTQYGTIPGATPAFEFWLCGEVGPRGGNITRTLISFNAKTLRADRVGGAWVVRDEQQVLYNFGVNRDAAALAADVIKKYGFNQIGIVGIPNPAMTYLTTDAARGSAPAPPPDPRELVGKVARQGLVLPKDVYAGPRVPLDGRRLEIARVQGEWTLTHGPDVLARFGTDGLRARDAQRLLLDARVTELALVGRSALPVFLSFGQAPRANALGFNNVHFRPQTLRAQQVNNSWCVTDGSSTLLEFGEDRAEAELVVKVLQHFGFDQFCPIGDPANGGMRVFLRSR
jgi:hypothetical protein